jgi:hypothetical protein
MDLLTNAIESIQVGVEDYKTGTRPRLLSAVRNIHAGILLLYKESLRRESPDGSNEVLTMANILPSRDRDGRVIFVGVGTKTVDTKQIRERFVALNIATDWGRFERVATVRNDIEHRYPKLDQKALHGVISDSFVLVRDFIATELKDDPRELLGEEAWQAMLEVAEVYQREKQECDRLIASTAWASPVLKEGLAELTCNDCGSSLLRPIVNSYGEVILQCSSCGEEQSPESYIPKALASALSGEVYIAMTDGGDPPIASCPECGADAFLTEEWRCIVCGAEPEAKCARCSNPIPVEELDSSPFCGYCEYISNKDD